MSVSEKNYHLDEKQQQQQQLQEQQNCNGNFPRTPEAGSQNLPEGESRGENDQPRGGKPSQRLRCPTPPSPPSRKPTQETGAQGPPDGAESYPHQAPPPPPDYPGSNHRTSFLATTQPTLQSGSFFRSGNSTGFHTPSFLMRDKFLQSASNGFEDYRDWSSKRMLSSAGSCGLKAKSRKKRKEAFEVDLDVDLCKCKAMGGIPHIHRPTAGTKKTLGVGLPCVRSDSLSDSNIKYTRSGRSCRRRWCACLVLAVLLIAIGTIAGIYFAYQFMGLDYAHERVFRGVFRVKDDQWRPEFADSNNDEYNAVVQEYKNRLDQLYSSSIFRKVFIRSEVLGLDRGTNNTLVVYFNIHINILRLELDAADLYVVFLVEVRRRDSRAFKGIQVDEDSVEIQERTHTSDVMPPNLETPFPAQGATSGGQIVARVDVTPSVNSALTTTAPLPTPTFRRCMPLDVNFCLSLHHNMTSYPNLLGHTSRFEVEEDIIPLREVVDSECHPLAFEFVCEMLQPDCRRNDGNGSGSGGRRTYAGSADRDGDEDEDVPVPPCRDFCSEVLAACGQRFPSRVREMINCNEFPTVVQGGECTPKPGCARELRVKGWGERVCDGVVDCSDMADEDFCPNCSPNSFRCGSGEPCISQRRRCDGVEDCANGADERGCLSLTPTPTDRNGLKGERWTKYNAEGLLRYTEAGLPSRVCVDNINKTLTTSEAHLLIHNMAEVTCDLLTYGGVKMVEVVAEDVFDHVPGLGYVQISDVYSTNITFEPVNCSRTTVVYMACTELECGVRPLYVDHQDSVAAKGVARTANSGDWPWVAALLKDGAHECDATLVNPLWLLTTSYCFQGEGRALWTARIGSIRVSSQAPWVQERRIVGMVKGDEPGNQIVLVKLEEAVQQSDYVRPACLGSHTAIPQLYGERCRGLGWGARRDPLVEIGIKVDGQRACAALEVKRRDANYICAHQTSPTDRCIVDEMSGAGLFCERTGRWEVVGVATGRTGCTVGNRPRYYEDVTPNIAHWVRKTIAQFAKKT